MKKALMQYDNAVDVVSYNSCKYFEERRYIACLKYTVTKKSTTDTSLVKLTKVVYVTPTRKQPLPYCNRLVWRYG